MPIRSITYFLLIVFAVLTLGSCHKKQVMCPGLGQTNEADLSLFDADGKLKDTGKKKKKSNTVGRFDANTGLIQKKKSPSKPKARKRV